MRFHVNYIYFGCYFLLLALLTASSIFTREPFHASRLFFFLYGLCQAAIETSVLVGITALLERFCKRKWQLFFIGLSFIFLTLHLLDFLLDRILDISIWQAIQLFVIDESLPNFIYLLKAAGISLWLWMVIFSLTAGLPIAGVGLYLATEKITKKHPLFLNFEFFSLSFFCLPTALLFWDFSAAKFVYPGTYAAFLHSIPWKRTFLTPQIIQLPIPNTFTPPLTEAQIEQSMPKIQAELEDKPNIYLFIIESFRADCITPKITPALFEFQKKCLPIDIALSNGNGSHLSWFSIFHSELALYWQMLKAGRWSMGSPPLQFLKTLGYKVRLYSSAELEYYGMSELLFGKNLSLIDTAQNFHHIAPKSAADSDLEAVQSLIRDLQDPALQKGQICIVFLDSTHFSYSWPKDWIPKFVPFANDFSYFKAFYSEGKIAQIKNRYLNSVQYIDSLFSQWEREIKNLDEAIIVVTGDHAEEFFEQGHLFHNSHLAKEQTRIPLLLHIPHRNIDTHYPIASQVDIFPTIIDAVSGISLPFLAGQSLLKENKWPFSIIARFNAGRTPYEFCIQSAQNKLIARFANRNNILQSRNIQIISMQDANDEITPISFQNMPDWIHQEFDPALQRLFSKHLE